MGERRESKDSSESDSQSSRKNIQVDKVWLHLTLALRLYKSYESDNLQDRRKRSTVFCPHLFIYYHLFCEYFVLWPVVQVTKGINLNV